MSFQYPSTADAVALLKRVKTIAVVGLSPKADRPSHGVSAAMQGFGYRIIPVHPTAKEILGEKAYPSLSAIPEAVDLVDVFRQPEFVDDVVDECLKLKLKNLWLQDGVVNEAAAERAVAGGMTVVMDRCVYRDYKNHCLAK
jgi:predicted CoA-binding protein